MRNWLKSLIRAITRMILLFVCPLFLLENLFLGRERGFRGQCQLLSLVPGLPGEYIRREYLRLFARYCASDAVVSFGTIFSSSEVELGERVYLGANCIIGHVRIGKNSIVASRVSIVSGLRQHGISRLDIPIVDQPGEFTTIKIGEDCWIGEGAIVAADIGDHSVVGAGSVVVKPVEPYSVVRGNPAEFVKSRKSG